MQHQSNESKARNRSHTNMPPVVKINNHHYMHKNVDSTKNTTSNNNNAASVSSPHNHVASATVPYKPPPSPTLNSKSTKMILNNTNDMPHPVPPNNNNSNSTPELATIHKRVLSPPVDNLTNARVMTVEVGLAAAAVAAANNKAAGASRQSKSQSRVTSGDAGVVIERRSTHLGTGKQSIRSSKRFVISIWFVFVHFKLVLHVLLRVL